MSPAHSGVWSEWFGDCLGRGVGNPTRDYIGDPESFVKWIQNNESHGRCSYASVQPFEAYEIPYCILTLFFDFDCKENPEKAGDEAMDFKARLERFYNVKAIVVFSGNKGYHLYVYLKTPIGKGLTIPQLKAVYNKLMRMLPGNADYESLDSSVVGDIKQLARIPYTHHEKTGNLCSFVDDDRNPIMVKPGFTKILIENGLSFDLCKNALYKVGREEKERREQKLTRPSSTRRRYKTIRPCIEAVLNAGNIHDPPHKLKVAAVAELKASGWGATRIIGAFSGMAEYKEVKTRDQVNQILREGYRPWLCDTITGYGGCLGDACAIYRRRNR